MRQLLTELVGLRDMVRTLKEEQAGCDRIVGMLDDIPEPLMVLDDAG